MEVPGICAMCGGVAEPAYTCNACGSIVCAKCYDSSLGICKRCVAQSTRGL